MIALVKKGMSRQEAHELLRQLAIKSSSEKLTFKEALLKNEVVSRMLTEREIDEALDPRKYLGTTIEQIESAIKKTLQERLERGLTE
jgi:adenylosuccinate lyase